MRDYNNPAWQGGTLPQCESRRALSRSLQICSGWGLCHAALRGAWLRRLWRGSGGRQASAAAIPCSGTRVYVIWCFPCEITIIPRGRVGTPPRGDSAAGGSTAPLAAAVVGGRPLPPQTRVRNTGLCNLVFPMQDYNNLAWPGGDSATRRLRARDPTAPLARQWRAASLCRRNPVFGNTGLCNLVFPMQDYNNPAWQGGDSATRRSAARGPRRLWPRQWRAASLCRRNPVFGNTGLCNLVFPMQDYNNPAWQGGDSATMRVQVCFESLSANLLRVGTLPRGLAASGTAPLARQWRGGRPLPPQSRVREHGFM